MNLGQSDRPLIGDRDPVIEGIEEQEPGAPARLSWADFMAGFRWEQGEHISLIGPTGAGKTTLALELLPMRDFVCVIATKPRDPVVSLLRQQGYTLLRKWPDHIDHRVTPRVILWPRFGKLTDLKAQQRIIHRALGFMFQSGGWTIYLDELSYLTKTLRLESAVSLLLQQGRSLGVSIVAGTQRPAHVPLLIYDQATHLFLWRDNDERNLRRMGGIGGLDAAMIRRTVAGLDLHDVLYVNTRGLGDLVVTRVDTETVD